MVGNFFANAHILKVILSFRFPGNFIYSFFTSREYSFYTTSIYYLNPTSVFFLFDREFKLNRKVMLLISLLTIYSRSRPKTQKKACSCILLLVLVLMANAFLILLFFPRSCGAFNAPDIHHFSINP